MKFWEWMTEKYIEWQREAIGINRSITSFALHVGVSQQTMSSWMQKDGKIPRRLDNIQKLVAAFGNEAYDALGLSRPVSGLENFPPDVRGRLERASTDILRVMEERAVYNGDSPEAEEIAIEIMARHGFEYIESSEDDDNPSTK